MTSTLLFFHLFGMTVILGLFGTAQVARQAEGGNVAPTRAWVLVAFIAATWSLLLSLFLLSALYLYVAYRLTDRGSARKPPSPGGPDPGAEPPP